MRKPGAEEERGLERGYLCQHTIGREVRCGGVGLHSGADVSMKLRPAAPNHGIRFRRTDICDHPTIIATANQVVDTRLATTIGFDGVVVSTIEHLMAALSGIGVDNVLVELDGPEVPIFDGSADAYVRVIEEAGLRRQNAPRRFLKVAKPMLIADGDAYIKATPWAHFVVQYSIDFPHPLVGRQEFSWSFNRTRFGRDIARARTFGFLRDVEHLQSRGLARGGSLANAMVFDDHRLLNHEGFRYSDECVRHKVLDFVGDLALAGRPLLGRFEVHKAGHALHNRFLKHLLAGDGLNGSPMPTCMPKPYFQAMPIPTVLDCFPPVAKVL